MVMLIFWDSSLCSTCNRSGWNAACFLRLVALSLEDLRDEDCDPVVGILRYISRWFTIEVKFEYRLLGE